MQLSREIAAVSTWGHPALFWTGWCSYSISKDNSVCDIKTKRAVLLGLWWGGVHKTGLQESTGEVGSKWSVARLEGQSSAIFQAPSNDCIYEMWSLAGSKDSTMVSSIIDGNHCIFTIDTIGIVHPDVLPREKREICNLSLAGYVLWQERKFLSEGKADSKSIL